MEHPESDGSKWEYEDIDAVDEQPADRGRKKMRDEGDREREAAFVKEEDRGTSADQTCTNEILTKMGGGGIAGEEQTNSQFQHKR